MGVLYEKNINLCLTNYDCFKNVSQSRIQKFIERIQNK